MKAVIYFELLVTDYHSAWCHMLRKSSVLPCSENFHIAYRQCEGCMQYTPVGEVAALSRRLDKSHHDAVVTDWLFELFDEAVSTEGAVQRQIRRDDDDDCWINDDFKDGESGLWGDEQAVADGIEFLNCWIETPIRRILGSLFVCSYSTASWRALCYRKCNTRQLASLFKA